MTPETHMVQGAAGTKIPLSLKSQTNKISRIVEWLLKIMDFDNHNHLC